MFTDDVIWGDFIKIVKIIKDYLKFLKIDVDIDLKLLD